MHLVGDPDCRDREQPDENGRNTRGEHQADDEPEVGTRQERAGPPEDAG